MVKIMKYKYTRKEIVKDIKSLSDSANALVDVPYCLDKISDKLNDLLATNSKEEESQRIMMEQVDITRCNKDVTKQDKPVCEHNVIFGMSDGKKDFGRVCEICHKSLPDINKYPIEDTNKTSLVVPKKISPIRWNRMTPETRERHLWEKQCELIDYLTLISLNKKI